MQLRFWLGPIDVRNSTIYAHVRQNCWQTTVVVGIRACKKTGLQDHNLPLLSIFVVVVIIIVVLVYTAPITNSNTNTFVVVAAFIDQHCDSTRSIGLSVNTIWRCLSVVHNTLTFRVCCILCGFEVFLFYRRLSILGTHQLVDNSNFMDWIKIYNSGS